MKLWTTYMVLVSGNFKFSTHAGDNLIVGSKEANMCWFDLDLSTRPYKTLKAHSKGITRVTFHQTYPLFASASDDCTAYVFHLTVYSDLNQNPLIVPMEILRGHKAEHGRGVLDCKYPTQDSLGYSQLVWTQRSSYIVIDLIVSGCCSYRVG